jgi:HK97 gp10 family phage protein
VSIVKLTWHGDAIKKRLDDAQQQGIDTTTAACDLNAKKLLNKSNGSGRIYIKRKATKKKKAIRYKASAPGEPPAKRTGILQGSISSKTAGRFGKGWRGEWGSYNNNYALWLEIGTAKMGKRPFLRPTAQEQYPKLAGRIRKLFAKGAGA